MILMCKGGMEMIPVPKTGTDYLTQWFWDADKR